MIRWRWPVQIALLVVFLALTVAAAWPANLPVISSAWLQWNPLVAGIAAIASRSAWHALAWSLPLVVATMLVGRFFCGWVCPFGTILDLSNRVFSRFRKKNNDKIRPRARWKYYTLIGVVTIAGTGSATGLIIDPLVLLTRTITLVFVPLAAWTGYGGVVLARLLPSQAALSAPFLESPPLYTWMTVTALVFIGIVMLERVERRFWCRNLCPLGALLGILSRTGLVKRSVEAECTACSLCERDCPMGAIPTTDFTSTHRDECILCMRCSNACSQSAVRFGIADRHDAPGFVPERRQVLVAAAAGIGLGLLSASSTHAAVTPAHVIRPPGSIPEDEFLARCTRCLACVEACPTHGLQPLGLDAGWAAIWSPILVPTVGGCEEPCHN
ncbi:MAG TPA: 4Fe-4S binding protein, partial [Firmicutes bacterium]|nr:4Fe-4S binding protein [Bacillota bacterium]